MDNSKYPNPVDRTVASIAGGLTLQALGCLLAAANEGLARGGKLAFMRPKACPPLAGLSVVPRAGA